MTLTLMPDLIIDIDEVKEYIAEIKEWRLQEDWACKFHFIYKEHSLYKNIMDQFNMYPGKLMIMCINPKSDFQIHVDSIRNSAIIIPIDGDFHMTPMSFYRDLESEEKLLSCTYEIGSAVLTNPEIPHGVHNPSDNYRTTIMINIEDPQNYESIRTAYLNGTLMKEK